MNPQELKSLADFQFERATYLKNLKDSIDARLTLVHQGGMFQVTPEFIAFLSAFADETMIVADIYNNPVEVTRETLLATALDVYRTVTAEWYAEFNKASRIRRASNV